MNNLNHEKQVIAPQTPTAREWVQHQLNAPQAAPQSDKSQQAKIIEQIKQKLIELDASLVAHYYTDGIIQQLAEETGGFISDSLEMARFGTRCPSKTLVVAGVKFMGETAKILNPEKRIIMPTLEATCSLDLGCPAEDLRQFRERYPDHKLVVYANTSAAVKAMADWVVTSGIAVELVEHILDQGKKIIWAPDKYLGGYIKKNAGASDEEMVLWDSACIVHEEFKANGIRDLQEVYPNAAVLVHPESPQTVVALADVVGSTTQLIQAAQQMPNQQFIVATDRGIFYKMSQLAPGKEFIEAPTAGQGASCRSCAHCPWMAMNTLNRLLHSLNHPTQEEITVSSELRAQALKPLQRMLDFKKSR